jgi:hypothetical protein
MKTIKLSTEQQLLILSMIREEIRHCRKKLRFHNPALCNFYIKELTRLRNVKHAILEANGLRKKLLENN